MTRTGYPTNSPTNSQTLAEQINALLPQTQCTQCGYAGCRPYAVAIAANTAAINQCPPGGAAGISKLAFLLDREALALDTAHGQEEPLQLALIEEEYCIGCTLCIQACPVDAIIGAPKQMHTVVADLCTGCKLCLPPCPVDCIQLVPSAWSWSDDRAAAAGQRFESRKHRLMKEKIENDERLQAKAKTKLDELTHALEQGVEDAAVKSAVHSTVNPDLQRKKAIIEAAIERARQRREQA